MAPLILYTHDLSPPASAVYMLANMLGLEIEGRPVDLARLEHKSEEFLKINPMGTIPVLVDGDFVVSESHAILKYLLQQYGGERREELYPSDARVRSRVDTCLFFNAGVFFVRLKVVALPIILEGSPSPSARQLADIELAYGALEQYLRAQQFAAAAHATLADLALAATAAPMQAIRKIDSKRFPRCVEWLSTLEKEPWYRGPSTTCVKTFTAIMETAWKKNNQ
ncbi:glutathione S-transferase 1-like [Plodia interpunctella]|uniref:glutathione S-transferase 1-like n=1 Tax=Plodia interpunctella TaxID=58824 RepID=UPI002368CABA|nr:glutathione S-transferase 1-like [Plodia interpunctella]XP_053625365.1 glutathione S-transferase 1-like [Plodia interpunctella]